MNLGTIILPIQFYTLAARALTMRPFADVRFGPSVALGAARNVGGKEVAVARPAPSPPLPRWLAGGKVFPLPALTKKAAASVEMKGAAKKAASEGGAAAENFDLVTI